MATTIALAATSSVPLSVATEILPAPASFAAPWMTVTLFFLRRCETPPDSCLATPRERFTIASRSKPIPSAFRPKSFARSIRWKISDDRSIALVGMQPQFRQMPPSSARSITATFSPSCAPRIAQT